MKQKSYRICVPSLNLKIFQDPDITLDGAPRAHVTLQQLEKLWINTGTLCNITCGHCYIESSPTNDRLVYITRDEVRPYLDEIEQNQLGTREIGFTGGEPFLNPHFIEILDECLSRGFKVLILTNAMQPLAQKQKQLLALHKQYGTKLTLRVSIDHYKQELHENERGINSWQPMIAGLQWLAQNEFPLSVAGRTYWDEEESSLRAGYARLFAELGLNLNAEDPEAFVLFPEMNGTAEVPEITTQCWKILGKSPNDVMCARSRMIVKRKGAKYPAVLSCTLIPYDPQFEMGRTLAESLRAVKLNHSYCAQFCVLGGGSCSV